jgi:hypothetical protein
MFWKEKHDKKESFVIGQCYKIDGKKVGKFIGIDKKRVLTDQLIQYIGCCEEVHVLIFIFNDNGKINNSYSRAYNTRGDSVNDFVHSYMVFSKYTGDYHDQYFFKYIYNNNEKIHELVHWTAEIDTCSSGGRRSIMSKKAFRRGRTTRKKSLRQRK